MPQIYRAIRPMFKTDRWRICRDDFVMILSGPEKGKTGKVLEVIKDRRVPQVIVEGCNLRKKKIPQGAEPDDFFVVTMEAPLHYSQVQVCDPETQKPFRVVYMYDPEGNKVRARKVPNPTINDILATPPQEDPNPRAGLVGKKDTSASLARAATYRPAEGFPFRPRNLERIWAELAPDAPPDGGDAPGEAAAAPAAAGSSVGGGFGRRLYGSSIGVGAVRSLCSVAAASTATAADPVAAAAVPQLAGGFALLGLRRGGSGPMGGVSGVAAGWEAGLGRRRTAVW